MGLLDWFESKAMRQYKARVAQNPDDAEAHFYLGAAYEEKGNARKAIQEFREALRIHPKSAEAHFNLGVLYESLNEGKPAVYHILKAGNLFGEKGDMKNKEKARKRLREYYQKFGFTPEDAENMEGPS